MQISAARHHKMTYAKHVKSERTTIRGRIGAFFSQIFAASKCETSCAARNNQDAFTCDRTIDKFEEERSLTKIVQEFGLKKNASGEHPKLRATLLRIWILQPDGRSLCLLCGYIFRIVRAQAPSSGKETGRQNQLR
ncbi:hypothetical protein TNCV_3997961 [Trichonephila clavipes]|nr:hypothetical protein TNCV_3997961 [Trichonephila clavipes]